MAEYIDREALPKKKERGFFLDDDFNAGWNACLNNIEAIPAADVRPVVLCRDCKRYGGRPWENNESGICARTDVGVGEFDFCSYGEKKEES